MKNKVVIVTGATKGMGLATTKHLLTLGANIVMVFCSDDARAEYEVAQLSEYADKLFLLKADIVSHDNRVRIIEKALTGFGRIDVLVNNAGIAPRAGFLNETEEEYDRVLDVNLKAPIFLAKLVAKQMIEQGDGGSIINISSIAGHRGQRGISYDASKAGIIIATQTMANVLGQHGIRVNSISPGCIKTEMNRDYWEQKPQEWNKISRVTLLQRTGEAHEIARTVV